MDVPVNQELAGRLERCDAQRRTAFVVTWMRREPTGAVLTLPGGAMAGFAAPGSPFNRAVGLGFDGPVAAATLDEVEAFFADHGVSPRVDLAPHSHGSLLSELRKRGYVPEQWLGLWGRRPPARGWSDRPWDDGQISVRRVESREHGAWVATVSEGFAGHASPACDPIAETAPYVPGTRLYLARHGAEDAGGASLAFEAGIAVLGGASTRPTHRQHGVHRALLLARLADSLSCELAVLHAAPGTASERNASRAGFSLLYNKLTLLGRFR